MKRYIGIWLDHEKATLVTLVNDFVELAHLNAEDVYNTHIMHGNSSFTHFGHQDMNSERRIERRHREHLHHFYRTIIGEIQNAEKIYIAGPGEAKFELKKEMKRIKKLAAKVAAVEDEDKMSDQEVISMVRDFFDED